MERSNESQLQPLRSELLPGATPHLFRVELDRAHFEGLLDERWEAIKSSLPAVLLAKHGLAGDLPPRSDMYELFGGRWKFYEQTLKPLVLSELAKASWPQEPLHCWDFGIMEHDGSCSLHCQVYFIPDVAFPLVLKPIVLSRRQVDPAILAEKAAAAIDAILSQRSTESDKGPDAVVADGDMIVATIKTTIDGERWPVGCVTRSKMRVIRGGLHPVSLYEALLGIGVGNYRFNFTLDRAFDTPEVEAEVTIHGILTYAQPSLTDAIAVELGSVDAGDLLGRVRQAVILRENAAIEQETVDAAIAGLVGQGKFDALPISWIKDKVDGQWQELYERSEKNDGLFCRSLGVPTKEAAWDRLFLEARAEMYRIQALLAYGCREQLRADRTETGDNFHSFVRRSIRHLVENLVRYS